MNTAIKKATLLLMLILSSMMVSAQMIYTPYYSATGSMENGKVTWNKYVDVNSASIFVSRDEIQFNFPGSKPLTFTGYQKVSKGETAHGRYNYYEGLTTLNGVKGNIRFDFLEDEWVIISLYIPSMPPPNNCIRAKCKFLTEM